jgi:hypothetical protein
LKEGAIRPCGGSPSLDDAKEWLPSLVTMVFNVTPAREWLTSLASEGRDHAEPLAAYEDELEFLLACEGPSETDLERIGHLLAAINTILPESIGDCITKLRMLAHSSIGIAVGDREDDVHSIEQVIGFLAQGWFIG